MGSYLKPRRGTKAMATSKLTTSGTGVLQKGEIFFEVPDAGEGKGEGKVKMGDGSTNYDSLPYFLDTSNFITKDQTYTTTSKSDTLANCISNLGNTISIPDAKGYTKRALKLLKTTTEQNASSITQLNNDLANAVTNATMNGSSLQLHKRNGTTSRINLNNTSAIKSNNAGTADYSKATASHNHTTADITSLTTLISNRTTNKLNATSYSATSSGTSRLSFPYLNIAKFLMICGYIGSGSGTTQIIIPMIYVPSLQNDNYYSLLLPHAMGGSGNPITARIRRDSLYLYSENFNMTTVYGIG